jgi:N-methylhydantoinase A
MTTRVAVDIGGTFTDLVCIDAASGDVQVGKGLSTPSSYEEGVAALLEDADVGEITSFVHGTTVVINALTERKGAVTALLTTRGMRDILEIQRGNRPDLFNLRYRKPEPFVPRRLRFEVDERIDFQGTVLRDLDVGSVREAVSRAVELGARAIAICFLHSYANPVHEQRAADLIRSEWPDLEVTASVQVCGEWREYPRASTAVCDAYVKPPVRRYLGALAKRLEHAGVPPDERYLMQSTGGIMRFSAGADAPVTLVESGPVGAVIASAVVADELGECKVISLDIGGTTAKAALVERDGPDGGLPVTDDYHIERSPREAGYPVKTPCVDIAEIGAGGGSIAWLDPAGSLRVGPQSAGADPGPACYGRGDHPTLTDANLIAGRIDADRFLGGRLRLDVARAERALRPLSNELGVTVEELALGIVRLADNRMVQLLRLVSVRRGRDPRDFVLVVSGGNGAIHGPALARELRIPRVVVPRHPGQFSAWGMLVSDLRDDVAQTSPGRLDEYNADRFETIWLGLRERLVGRLARRPDDPAVVYSRSADLRYVGQEHAVRVPVPDGPLDAAARATIHARFEELHERLFTFRQDAPSEIVTFRLTGVRAISKPPMRPVWSNGGASTAAIGRRTVDFDGFGRVETPLYRREHLGAGAALDGPAVVEEDATATIVGPDQRLTVTPSGPLVIEMVG